MKIMMFSDSYGSVTTTFIRNEVNYFSRAHELLYVAQSIEGPPGGVRTEELPFTRSYLMEKLSWYLWKADLRCTFRNKRFGNALNTIIERESPQVIHCHFAYESLKLLQNVPVHESIAVFVHFHGYDASQMLKKKSYVRAVNLQISKKNIVPIVVSDYMRNGLERAGIDVSKAKLLRYGVDVAKFKPGAKEEDRQKITFLQVSSLAEKKGHEYTIRAFSLFLRRNPEMEKRVKVIFTGEGPRKDALRKLVNDEGLENIVHFAGNVDQQGAISLLRQADFFIHHSVTAKNGDEEGIPNAIIEAMSMEQPVLSTFHAGIPELVKHRVNGLLCKERDIEKYASHLQEILSWKPLPANRDVVKEQYNMDKHNRQLENIFLEAISKQ